MIVCLHALDHQDAKQKRLDHVEAHRAYLASAPFKILLAGPMVDDDGAMIGSLVIAEAESTSSVKAFARADPLNKNGVWASLSVHAYNMRVDNLSAPAG